MQNSPMGQYYYGELSAVADYAILAMDGDEVVAAGYSAPFALGIAGREEVARHRVG